MMTHPVEMKRKILMNGLMFREIQLQNTTRVDRNLEKRVLASVQTAASSSPTPNKLIKGAAVKSKTISKTRANLLQTRSKKAAGKHQVRDFIFESSSIKLTPVLRFTSPAHAHFPECFEVLRLSHTLTPLHTSADASTVLLGTLGVQAAGLELLQLATAASERSKDACDQICVVF